MKTTIKCLILWALALVIYVPKGMAQGFVEPKEHTREYNPDEGFTNVILFEGEIYGDDAKTSSDVFVVRNIGISLNPSNFSSNLSGVKVGLYSYIMDTTYYYNGDINFQSGEVILRSDFRIYKRSQKFTIEASIKTDGLKNNDMLSVYVNFETSRDNGKDRMFIFPEPQYLVYKKQVSTSVQGINSQDISSCPNPFVNELTINLPREEKVTITNMLGQTVYSGSSISIETSLFPIGMYFVQTSYGICKVVKYNN